MTTKRTRFDRRKKPPTPIMALPALAPEQPKPEPTHKRATAPWRTRRPWSKYVLYRLSISELVRWEQDEVELQYRMAQMEKEYANDNSLDPPNFEC